MTTPLKDEDNVRMRVVEEEPVGYTVEEAYAVLAGQPLPPVAVEPEE